ncbi:MAG: hypothetical protein HXY51_15510 [Nitrospirae bacterium]|nr:hypothetical protein [Nitrospirota bacterium]
MQRQREAVQQRGQPVISVDTKKKELVGRSRTLAASGNPRASPMRSRRHKGARNHI